MAAYMFDRVERRLTPQMIRQVSAFLDERPSSTRKAVAVALPALLAGLAERASTARGAETLLNVIHRIGVGLDLEELAARPPRPPATPKSERGLWGPPKKG